MMAEDTCSINVTFPTGKRSEVIVEATAAYLRRIKVLAALKETQGAWRDEDHPELVTPEDVNRWLASRRSSWRRVIPVSDDRLDATVRILHRRGHTSSNELVPA
jgi:hypothetical protein